MYIFKGILSQIDMILLAIISNLLGKIYLEV